MDKRISNVVLTCSSTREYEVAERVLDRKGFEWEQYGDALEVYESMLPGEWEQLIQEIEQEAARQ